LRRAQRSQKSSQNKKKLVNRLTNALRPYLDRVAAQAADPFQEAASTSNPAVFFEPTDVLGRDSIMEAEYRYDLPQAFYLRLMPTTNLPPVKQTRLMDIARNIAPDVLSPDNYDTPLHRNNFGVAAIEIDGGTPESVTQFFKSGEIWGITRTYLWSQGSLIVIAPLERIYCRVLSNYCDFLTEGLDLAPPFNVILGAVGLLNREIVAPGDAEFGPILADRLELRRVLHDTSKASQEAIVREFVDAILGLTGASRS
jgi:hypothetical protein